MTAPQQPVIEVSIEDPRNLGDVQKWAALAVGLSIPESATVVLSAGGRRLAVRAFIANTEPPIEE